MAKVEYLVLKTQNSCTGVHCIDRQPLRKGNIILLDPKFAPTRKFVRLKVIKRLVEPVAVVETNEPKEETE